MVVHQCRYLSYLYIIQHLVSRLRFNFFTIWEPQHSNLTLLVVKESEEEEGGGVVVVAKGKR